MSRARLAGAWTLALALSGALEAHPLGSGLFNLNGALQIVGRNQAGDYEDSSSSHPTIHATKGRLSDMHGGAGLSVPMLRPFGLDASASVYQWTDEIAQVAQYPAFGTAKADLTDTGHVYHLGLLCWPSEFFRPPFETGADGNPDGPLLWPVLHLSGDWEGDSYEPNLLSHTGGYSGATVSAPYRYEYFSAFYGITLPLTDKLSVFASYGQEYSRELVQKNLVVSDGGDSELLGGGVTAFLTWDKSKPVGDPDLYIPTIGWPGQCRAELSYMRQLFRPSGRIVSQDVALKVDCPLSGLVSVGMGYRMDIADRGYLDGIAGLRTSSYNTIEHLLSLDLTVSLGGFSWVKS